MESVSEYHSTKALLDWQIELGVDETIAETPLNRYDLTPKPAGKPKSKPTAAVPEPARLDVAAMAQDIAERCGDLAALEAALVGFDQCELKRGARSTVFADGNPAARVMIIGEAPGRDEDIQGKPFVGRAGQLLDRMLGEINLARHAGDSSQAVYITNVLPWRPPQNRDPEPDEITMLMPFVKRHVELAKPDILVLMGNSSCQAILGRKGITRLRGNWTNGLNLPVLPMFHPAYLLRNPASKREAWHDLLSLQARLRDNP